MLKQTFLAIGHDWLRIERPKLTNHDQFAIYQLLFSFPLTFSIKFTLRPASSSSFWSRILSAASLMDLSSKLFKNVRTAASKPVTTPEDEFRMEISNLNRTDSPNIILIVDIASRTFRAPSGSMSQILVKS